MSLIGVEYSVGTVVIFLQLVPARPTIRIWVTPIKPSFFVGVIVVVAVVVSISSSTVATVATVAAIVLISVCCKCFLQLFCEFFVGGSEFCYGVGHFINGVNLGRS